jgi:hypothetical protein
MELVFVKDLSPLSTHEVTVRRQSYMRKQALIRYQISWWIDLGLTRFQNSIK